MTTLREESRELRNALVNLGEILAKELKLYVILDYITIKLKGICVMDIKNKFYWFYFFCWSGLRMIAGIGYVLTMVMLGMVFVAMILFMGYGALSWLHSKGIFI